MSASLVRQVGMSFISCKSTSAKSQRIVIPPVKVQISPLLKCLVGLRAAEKQIPKSLNELKQYEEEWAKTLPQQCERQSDRK